jgi:hypothetical protein
MIGRTNVDLRRRALIVDTDLERPATAGGRATREISDELRQRDVEVVEAASFSDGVAVAGSDAAIHCVFVNWTSDGVAPDDATALSVMEWAYTAFWRACLSCSSVFCHQVRRRAS